MERPTRKRRYIQIKDWPLDWQSQYRSWKALPTAAERRELWNTWDSPLQNQVYATVATPHRRLIESWGNAGPAEAQLAQSRPSQPGEPEPANRYEPAGQSSPPTPEERAQAAVTSPHPPSPQTSQGRRRGTQHGQPPQQAPSDLEVQSHNWEEGARIGEASHPGPRRGTRRRGHGQEATPPNAPPTIHSGNRAPRLSSNHDQASARPREVRAVPQAPAGESTKGIRPGPNPPADLRGNRTVGNGWGNRHTSNRRNHNNSRPGRAQGTPTNHHNGNHNQEGSPPPPHGWQAVQPHTERRLHGKLTRLEKAVQLLVVEVTDLKRSIPTPPQPAATPRRESIGLPKPSRSQLGTGREGDQLASGSHSRQPRKGTRMERRTCSRPLTPAAGQGSDGRHQSRRADHPHPTPLRDPRATPAQPGSRGGPSHDAQAPPTRTTAEAAVSASARGAHSASPQGRGRRAALEQQGGRSTRTPKGKGTTQREQNPSGKREREREREGGRPTGEWQPFETAEKRNSDGTAHLLAPLNPSRGARE